MCAELCTVGNQMLTILKPPTPASDPDIMEAIRRAMEIAGEYPVEHISIQMHVAEKAYITIDAVPAGK
jgi:hypothetical protein